jgi:hypothetical protein
MHCIKGLRAVIQSVKNTAIVRIKQKKGGTQQKETNNRRKEENKERKRNKVKGKGKAVPVLYN